MTEFGRRTTLTAIVLESAVFLEIGDIDDLAFGEDTVRSSREGDRIIKGSASCSR